jgi:hypothetical protein
MGVMLLSSPCHAGAERLLPLSALPAGFGVGIFGIVAEAEGSCWRRPRGPGGAARGSDTSFSYRHHSIVVVVTTITLTIFIEHCVI